MAKDALWSSGDKSVLPVRPCWLHRLTGGWREERRALARIGFLSPGHGRGGLTGPAQGVPALA